MSAEVCTPGRLFVGVVALLSSVAMAPAASAQTATVTVAWFNIQSGKGEPGMAGHAAQFADNTNCTDPTQPMNGWGTGLVQQHLLESVGSDPRIIAIGLAEAWTCGSPENVRKLLGWKSKSGNQNGVAMVARYGFAGGEEWVQLDTSLNPNPVDTMWVLRVPVCLNETCSTSMNIFASHWYASGTDKRASYDRQAAQTVAFLQRAGGAAPHILVGDLNAWDGTTSVCGEGPTNIGLQRLRDAGYLDAWPLLQGSAEGFTGMTNRAGCGSPEGYAYKRPDYTWSPITYQPVSIKRFGIVPAGDAAPSDHYGLITEFPFPSAVVPVDVAAPTVALVAPAEGFGLAGGSLSISVAASDDLGVARVEILEDGVVEHTLAAGQSEVICTRLGTLDGPHTIAARAYDQAGNMALSDPRHIMVASTRPASMTPPGSGDIVLYARHATAIAGNWQLVADTQAAGGARMWNPDAGVPKLAAASAMPSSYFELTFDAAAGKAYRLWVRGRADKNAWTNDSVYVQFDDSVTAAGTPVNQIGTTSGTWVGIEDCSGCGLLGWGWQDNGYGTGVLGPLVYFAKSGPHTLRIQQREDGISVDQVVLSPSLYLTIPPGAQKSDATIFSRPPVTVSAAEILIRANAVTTLAGAWKLLGDASAADGTAVGHPDAGGAKLAFALAVPVNYVEFAFQAEAGRAYRLWMRGRADNDSWANDSVFVQFSGAVADGKATARIGTSDSYSVNLEDAPNAGVAGWGWQDNGYGTGVLGPLIMFDATGPQTVRIQTREDGVRIDQIVLSSGKYLSVAPGPLKKDTTILH